MEEGGVAGRLLERISLVSPCARGRLHTGNNRIYTLRKVLLHARTLGLIQAALLNPSMMRNQPDFLLSERKKGIQKTEQR